MAVLTLSTSVCRRTMLTGGALAAALPAIAAMPDPGADGELFRRIAVAERLRKRHARACRLRDRLWKVMARHGDLQDPAGPDRVKWREIAEAELYREARLHRLELQRCYARAVRAAVAVPAQTVRGVQAKLALALIAARPGDARIYLYESHDYLEAAVADLSRIAAQGRPVLDGPTSVGAARQDPAS